ncbi:MAG TPA: DUF6311 domain-containing protein [Dokdonella sp.]
MIRTDQQPQHGPRFDSAIFALLCLLLLADAWYLLTEVGASSTAAVPGLGLDRAVVAFAAFLFAAYGALAWRRGGVDTALAFAIGATCGVLFFVRTLGTALADPTAIGWLLHGDMAQHYSGWEMFRHTPWAWPPGKLPELWYPVGTSIVFTDSLPLLALLLKPFSAWLTEPFQYIGPWVLLNCAMQGGFGALLIARATRGAAVILAGAALFVVAPIFINRLGHDTLTTQWLLLAALWLYFRAQPPARLAAEAAPWWLLSAAILVHPYLGAMTLAIQLACWGRRVLIDHARSRWQASIAFGTSLLIALLLWWLSGAMTLPHKDSGGGLPYGPHSFNLLGFANPMGFSRVLPNLPYLREQYEGFAYAGIGMLALAVVAAALAAIRRTRSDAHRRWLPLALVALALSAFAASTVLAIGNWKIIDMPIRGPILASFRASGRFIWVAYYALMLLILWTLLRRLRYAGAVMLLSVALLAQLWDFSLSHRRFARMRIAAIAIPADTQLSDPRWARLAEGRHHLTLLPPGACAHEAGPYLPFQLFAAAHSMTLNSGYLARWDARGTGRYCAELGAQLAAGTFGSDDLYVLGDEWRDAFLGKVPTARCETLDGYQACVIDASAP